MELSIVIPNWNGIKHLPECLSSIYSQTYNDYEIIIIDNGSTDGSIEFVSKNYPDAIIVQNPTNFGYCKSANQGIGLARGQFLLLLNNDTRLDQHFLLEIIQCWKKAPEDVIGIFPKAVYYNQPDIINSAGVQWTRWGFWQTYSDGIRDSEFNADTSYVFGDRFIAPCLRLDLIKQIGGFDEKFISYSEDFDVSYRANVLGYRFVLCPQAVLFHKMSQTLTDNKIHQSYKLRLGLRNYAYVLIKNYSNRNLLIHAPWFFLRIYVYNGILKSIKRSGLKEIVNIFYSVGSSTFDVLKSIPMFLEERKTIQRRRKVSDELIWKRKKLETLSK